MTQGPALHGPAGRHPAWLARYPRGVTDGARGRVGAEPQEPGSGLPEPPAPVDPDAPDAPYAGRASRPRPAAQHRSRPRPSLPGRSAGAAPPPTPRPGRRRPS